MEALRKDQSEFKKQWVKELKGQTTMKQLKGYEKRVKGWVTREVPESIDRGPF